jgi:hypothetical protein
VVDGEGIDLRSVLGVEELGHPASAAMLAYPRANRKEDRQEVAPGFRQQVFVPWRTVPCAAMNMATADRQ